MDVLSSDKVMEFLAAHREELRVRFSVARIGVFGSVARGDSRADSDVDILVELAEPTFDHYMDLKFYLEQSLGRQVDLVLADSLKPRLAPVISREVTYV